MMFEDKNVDPRDCKYRLLTTSKLRKQIDRLFKAKKLEFGLIKPKQDPVDFYESINQQKDKIVNNKSDNRLRKRNQPKSCNKENGKDEESDQVDNEEPIIEVIDFKDESQQLSSNQKRIISKMDQVETILNRVDEDQKQTFKYEDLTQLHRLLQHLDESPQMDMAKEYFHQFMENNFRVIQGPEKRQNAQLDERLRKLKFKAASDDYDSMVSNVANYIIGGPSSSKSSFPSIGQELRNIRGTLMATINAMMVIGATFFFFYITIGYARPDYDTGKVVLYSFGASMVVAMAELYFLIRII